MLHAFADGEDVRIGRAEIVGNDNATVDIKSGGPRQSDLRADADCENHQIARHLPPIRQSDPGDAIGAQHLLGLAVGEERDAAIVEVALQQLAGGDIQLAFHQRGHQVNHRHLHAAPLQPPGCFQSQQTAADDHGPAMCGRCADHRFHVMDVAEGAHAWQVQPGDGRHDRLGAGGEQQPFIMGDNTGQRGNGVRHRVNRHHRIPRVQRDLVFIVPGARIDLDFGDGFLPGQHR